MVHILKTIRDTVDGILESASIKVSVSGVPTEVFILKSPPRGSEIDEDELPALFVFIQGETIEPGTYLHYQRTISIVIYMFARAADNPLDQLDAMQLQIEVALDADPTLGGSCSQYMPVAMAAHTDQGSVNFGARSLEYRCVTNVTSNNPTI